MSDAEILKDFKGSMVIDQEGHIVSSEGTLSGESKEFAQTILSMLQDINFITTNNKQDFKRLSINYHDVKYIVTISNNKIYVVVQ